MSTQRVLIADDEKLLRMLMADILCRHGFEAVTVDDGLSVLQRLQEDGKFSLIISDIHMPGMDGIRLLQVLRQRYPHIPILITSVHSATNIVDQVVEQGAVFLPRPFTARQLVDAAQRALNNSR